MRDHTAFKKSHVVSPKADSSQTLSNREPWEDNLPPTSQILTCDCFIDDSIIWLVLHFAAVLLLQFEIPEWIGSATSLAIAIAKKASKSRRKDGSREADGGLDWEGTRRQEPKRTRYRDEKNKPRKDLSPQNHFCHYLWSKEPVANLKLLDSHS